MERKTIDLYLAVLNVLKDAEYHSIIATTLKVSKYFHLSKNEINEIFSSRKQSDSLSSKKIYTQVQLSVSQLRKAKFIQDFPNTKNKGIFAITNKGLLLLEKNTSQRKTILNSEITKYSKKINPLKIINL